MAGDGQGLFFEYSLGRFAEVAVRFLLICIGGLGLGLAFVFSIPVSIVEISSALDAMAEARQVEPFGFFGWSCLAVAAGGIIALVAAFAWVANKEPRAQSLSPFGQILGGVEEGMFVYVDD